MTENTIAFPEAQSLRLGVNYRSRWDAKRITMLAPTVASVLPNPPSSISAARRKIISGIPWGLMLNDELGDCTIAGKWHIVQADTTYEKHPFVQSDPYIRGEYMHLTGGVDSGLALLDVLNPWHEQTDGHGLAAFAEVPWTDRSLSASQSRKLLKLAIYLSGASYIAVELPTALQRTPYDWTNVGTGPDWRAGTWGGHCVPILYYVSTGGRVTYYIVTWGRLVPVSEAFLRTFMPEAWMPVTHDWANAKGNTPNGRAVSAVVDLAHKIAA